MKNFSTVFNFELKQFFGKKATKVIMAVYFIIAIGITFIPSIANSNFFKGDNNDNYSRSAYVVKDVSVQLADLKEAKKYDSKEALEKDIKDNKLDEGIVLTKDSYEYLSKQTIFSKGESEFKDAFGKNVEKFIYKQNGLDYEKVNNVKSRIPQPLTVNVSGDSDAQTQAVNIIVVYVLTFIVYMTVIQFGSVVATNVVKEKSNRAMELLVVTVSPRTLIVGKVLALSVGVLIQMGLIIGGLFAGLKINSSKYSDNLKHIIENMDLKVLGVGVVFALTGFVMFMFMYAAFASLVSKIEDVNGALTVPMLIFMGAFFVNYYIMSSTGDTKLAEILSYVPFTSYFVMFTRFAISHVSMNDLAVSYGILVGSTLIIALISVRVYRLATLRYGQKLNFFKLLFGK
jgi:hypothetical protein